MIKGWRLNPEWVKYKEQKKDELVKRQLERVKLEFMIEDLDKQYEQSLKDLERSFRGPSLRII